MGSNQRIEGKYLWLGALVGFVTGVFCGFIYGRYIESQAMGLVSGMLTGTGLGLMVGVVVANAKRLRVAKTPPSTDSSAPQQDTTHNKEKRNE